MANAPKRAPTARAAKTAAPPRRLVRLSTSAPTQQADNFLHDRGEDAYAMRGLSVDRDISPIERLKAVRLSRMNYKRSGIYGQLIDTLVNFVVGDGIEFKFKDEKLGEEVRRVLDHPLNDFDRSIRMRATTLFTDGEYLLSITLPLRDTTTKAGGKLSLTTTPLIGRMDSDSIEDVHCALVNQDRVVAVTVNTDGAEKRTFPIAAQNVEPVDNGDGTATAVLLWRCNVLRRRGLPFFSRTLDKASRLDGVVDELARKAAYTSRFWMHATYEDQGKTSKNKAVEKKLLAWLRSIKPGEALASTTGVEVKVVAPDLGLPDQKALYDLIVDYILGSHGVPRMWFSSGDGTNRATGVEQGTPIFRAVDAAQSEFIGGVRDLVNYVVWILKRSGAVPESADESYTITPSDVATRDSIRDVKEVNELIAALDGAVLSGIISAEERQIIGRRVLASKGWGDALDEKAPDLTAAEPATGADPSGLPVHRLDPGGGADGTGDPGLPGSEMGAGGARGPSGGAGDVQASAMNGAQVTALADIVQKVADGTLPADAARPLILGAFPMFPETLIDSMISAADKFEPPKKPAPVVVPPPGGGAPPPPPNTETKPPKAAAA